MEYIFNVIISIIIGLCVGFIIGNMLLKKVKYKGPDSNEIKKNIYEDNKGKYRWNPKVCICPILHSMFKLKNKDYIDEH